MADDNSAPRRYYMPKEADFFRRLERRRRRGRIGRLFNYFSILVAGLALVALFFNVVNEAFGAIGVVNTVEPETLTAGRPLADLSKVELADILAENIGWRLRVLIRDTISQVENARFTKATVAEIVGDETVDPAIAGELLKAISKKRQAGLLARYADIGTLRNLVLEEVVEQQVIASFTLGEAIFNFAAIKAKIEGPILDEYKRSERLDDARVTVIRFHSWLDGDFLTTPMSSTPALAGVRTALIGSIGLMAVVIAVALPVGVGAAIYLEEYAHHGFVNRLIETNVRNLAGVPSIIYGMLGLAIFVRALAPFSSGIIFGYNFDAPSVETVIERISPIFDGEINFDGVAMSSDSAEVETSQLGAVVDAFLRFGTPSLTMQGNAAVIDMSNALADALDIAVETLEVAVVGENRGDPMLPAQRGGLRVEQQIPPSGGPAGSGGQQIEEAGAGQDDAAARRSDDAFEEIHGLLQRRRWAEDPPVGDDPQKFHRAEDGQAPVSRALGERNQLPGSDRVKLGLNPMCIDQNVGVDGDHERSRTS